MLMSRRRLHFTWGFLITILAISGCFSSGAYTVDRAYFDYAMTRSPEERQRTAVPAQSSTTGKPVWLTAESLENATVLSNTGSQLAVEAKSREYATPVGLGLVALGLPLIVRGSVLIASNKQDNAAWLLGGDGPGVWLGVGIASAAVGVTLFVLGRTMAWQEVKPRKRGWIYAPLNVGVRSE
jgi:hypothetical protein